MKNVLLSMCAVALICAVCLGTISCSRDDASQEGTSTTSTTSTTTGTAGSGDLDQFIQDYEAFINTYCELAQQIRTAPMAQKPQLIQKWTEQLQKLSGYNEQIISMKASASPAAKARFEALEKKATECSKALQSM
ncbi:MAG TPA: hypothetical protein PLI62_12100 [Spirochaetota bacterium]|nr:hypothetical protein [Spirochaetota bacterium]HQP49554.1 hypothetical protein [Spirochaetota bacterium]